MKYLKEFADNNAYNQFKKSPNYVWPNVSKVDIDSSSFTMDYHKEENNVIRYWAPSKLPETTSNKSGGLHTDKFNTTITEHTFENGMGVIKFAENVTTINSASTVDKYHYGAFGNTNITHIILPSTLTNIGACAFTACQNLIEIELPSSITSIGNYAFTYCYNLISVKLPNLLTSIGNSAFESDDKLVSITIPDSVTSIGDSAFYMCKCITNVKIPDSVTSIGAGAFSNSGIKNITIPDSVTSIGASAFFGCNVTSIKIHSNNSIYDSRNNCNAIIETSTNKLLKGCKNTIIPENIASIEDYAFIGCIDLTNIIIPNSVITIGNGAFQSCSNLTSIIIPDSVQSIGAAAFSGCFNLTNITLGSGLININNYTFGDSYIQRSNFINNSSLDAVTNNYWGAKIYDTNDNGLYIKDNSILIYKGTATNVIIPNTITSIRQNAFYNCTNLISITIPNSVINIGSSAFSGCTGLTSITIPNSVTTIDSLTFGSCTNLTSVTIPDNITSIGNGAFTNCTNLTSIDIPNSVTSIGASAFSNCNSLTSITVNSTTPPTLSNINAFSNTNDCPIYVPGESIELYKYTNTNNWYNIRDRIQAISE